jgi:hypothetical protein
MSNQYEDTNQEYQHSFPQVWPDGTEFTVYTTPDNCRTILKHSSGSHIEFKNDGTVVIKAVKDLHINSSVNSSPVGDGNEDATASEWNCESDLHINVAGKLSINCNSLDVATEKDSRSYTGGDMIIDSNNLIQKAREQISLEPVKSMYVSTGEYRENIVTRTSEIGTVLGGNLGGQSTMKVNGHFVIENQDPKGGITIKSAGYTNILTAAERIDLTGNPGVVSPIFDPTPLGVATYTHIVSPYPGPTPKGIPGSVFIQCGPGPYTEAIGGPMASVIAGPRTRTVLGGLDELKVTGTKITTTTGPTIFNANPFIVNASMIFLN